MICPVCGSEFEEKRKSQKYCSVRCKNEEYRDENKEYFKEYRKEYYDENKDKIIEHIKEYRKKNLIIIKNKIYNKNTAPEEIKPILEGLILARQTKKLLKECVNE